MKQFLTIHLDGETLLPMPTPPRTSTARPVDEKLTINLGVVDLGQIDLLVREGFYSNRSDLIRTAIRRELERHADAVRQAAERRTLVLGIREFSARDLMAARDAGEKLVIRVLGLASFADDVTPALALETIESITVLGVLHASPALRKALAERLH